ncbi:MULTISPECIES: hypothetical protein [unclassified Enterococcus]|uniref:hypothetical protein n=1 Tax=unclassified Enterococcus TaxID=2608891 RepID=UPI00155774D2|nr:MULTISPECIES: hypothetical protein [unclassified Enterococcus]MBS7577228.1 hypothetical protein [Enterococcus sp. MMGLQ5-2]MBS7584679.1 hypothetical protein [Enterococcus sp. MMGLQ5-1]NPD12534.1 hypothetical protein [Enterococcus sp. MMGLQ5-1]NPD37062.1 hypothetical protein [Enterococcus sp. MMGLQ5-2]
MLQNLPDYFYYPSIFPLFYQPLRFRIELIEFLKQSRTFSELMANFADRVQLPILIKSQLFIKAILAFEIQCLAAQRLLVITNNKFKIIDKQNVQVSAFKIQSPLQINQWLSAQLRDGKRNEKRKIIDS